MQVLLDKKINRRFIFPMKEVKQRDPALQSILEKRGMAVKLATKIGIRPQAISAWTRVPVARVLVVEEVTGVPRHVLRPDVYPKPERAECAA